MNRYYDAITFILIYIFILRRPIVANFADIITITIMFIKATFIDSNEVKRIINYVKMQSSVSAHFKESVT